ncbi:hypothetical protein LCGC14_0344440 [marine sediment metagenome]|uniref:Uncharacterized protein n=1 Tax=marine sediment metagenome TaxID=412755 RepID=A0A0F9WKF7_9ZZZZ
MMKHNPKDPEGLQFVEFTVKAYGPHHDKDGNFKIGSYSSKDPSITPWVVSLTGEAREKTITDMVIEDLRERGVLGAFDGRDSHQDLYEKLLDAAQYVKKAMIERERLERENADAYADLPDI